MPVAVEEDLQLKEAITKFTEHLTGQKAPASTVRAYTTDLALWLDWLAQETVEDHLRQLTHWHIADYLTHLAKQGFAAASIRRKLAAIRYFCTWSHTSGLVRTNPAQGVRGPKLPQRMPAVLTTHEYRALLYATSKHPRDHAIVQLFLQTGIREGELCALTLQDLDLIAKELHVRNRKGGVDTLIPLNHEVLEPLRTYLNLRPAAPTDHLFLSKTKRPLTPRSVRFLVKNYLKRADILLKKPTASVHTLRHTFGTHKAAKGVDIATLQYWMGHKKKETTYGYIHLAKTPDPQLMGATAL